ncbi:MAG: hypothetical protein NVSMB34_03210 [Variovorax sp.]
MNLISGEAGNFFGPRAGAAREEWRPVEVGELHLREVARGGEISLEFGVVEGLVRFRLWARAFKRAGLQGLWIFAFVLRWIFSKNALRKRIGSFAVDGGRASSRLAIAS